MSWAQECDIQARGFKQRLIQSIYLGRTEITETRKLVRNEMWTRRLVVDHSHREHLVKRIG